jgi:hypothetical protein
MDTQPPNERDREYRETTREIHHNNGDGSGMGFLLGIILIIVLLILFFVYGLPDRDTEVDVPDNNDAGIDVDLNLPDNTDPTGGDAEEI